MATLALLGTLVGRTHPIPPSVFWLLVVFVLGLFGNGMVLLCEHTTARGLREAYDAPDDARKVIAEKLGRHWRFAGGAKLFSSICLPRMPVSRCRMPSMKKAPVALSKAVSTGV